MASGRVPKMTMTRFDRKERGLLVVVLLVVLFTFSYTVAVFLVSNRQRPPRLPGTDNAYFVFVLPCLNEELVIGRSIESLLALPSENFSILVIDDGSEDKTAEIASSYDAERVWLLQRRLPDARKGKGEALNAAYRYLRDSGVLRRHSHNDVVVAILDADGRIASDVLTEVAPYFRDPNAGAVQIGVRMYNADENLLARLQDFEFVTFTEIFQKGRQRIGSVGLGGNGQFTRLAALASLGDSPWTDCLTEDLDLGIRLLAQGWENNFCPWAHVSQQAVTSPRRLIRQRARWFQGHLQCWRRIPDVILSPVRDRVMVDVLYHLLTPGLVLAMSLPIAAFFVRLVSQTFSSPLGVLEALTARGGVLLAGWYLLSFGLAPLYGFVYSRRERSFGFVKATALAHLYNLYTYLWFAAGWLAVWNIATRRRGWAKTARTPEDPSVDDPPAVPISATLTARRGAAVDVPLRRRDGHVPNGEDTGVRARRRSAALTIGILAIVARGIAVRARHAKAAGRSGR
jgi:1,2-diacylglycerol 3-beta-glucosyltransferase